MATRRRAGGGGRPRPAPGRAGRARGARLIGGLQISAQIYRSLIGLLLLVVGAVTLVALLFPQAGLLNRYVADVLRPAFGQGAWLLAILLIVAGAIVERAPHVGHGWTVTAIGGLVVFLGGLGLIHLVWGRGDGEVALSQAGGALGNTLSSGLSDLVSPAGAFIVL